MPAGFKFQLLDIAAFNQYVLVYAYYTYYYSKCYMIIYEGADIEVTKSRHHRMNNYAYDCHKH